MRNHSYENVLCLQIMAHFHTNKTTFHMNSFALKLFFRERYTLTRKYPFLIRITNMATANFTGDERQKTVEQQLCNSSGFLPGLQGYLTFLSVVNEFMSVTVLFGSILVLIALYKKSSLQP